MRRSITVYPQLSREEISAVKETQRQYSKAFNLAVRCLVRNNSESKRFLHKEQYGLVRQECPHLPTGLIQCSRDVAVESVKSWNTKKTKARNEKKRGRKSREPKIPSMKEKCTMRYDVRTVTLRGGQLTFSTCSKRIRAIISIPSFFRERYPENEGWKMKGANIGINSKGRVFVSLVFECHDEVPFMEDGKIVGLDRGLYNIIATSDGERYGSKGTRAVKRKYNHVRSELQEKGTRSAKRRLKEISGREKRFVHDQNHCISKKLANAGYVSVYVLEDLEGISHLRCKGESSKTMRKWLSGWSYRDLEAKLEYKCSRNGIQVVKVDARYTSQKCSVCKTIDKSSRKGNQYVCVHCGNRMHADHNAAVNIRDNYITCLQKGRQAAVNQPYGWNAAGKPETEPTGKRSCPSL